MDVLAAIALASEPPHPTKLRKDRVKLKDKIITPFLIRSILSQTVYQAIVLTVLLYLAPAFFGLKYNIFTEY